MRCLSVLDLVFLFYLVIFFLGREARPMCKVIRLSSLCPVNKSNMQNVNIMSLCMRA